MDMLIILLVVQLSGVALSLMISYLLQREDQSRIFIGVSSIRKKTGNTGGSWLVDYFEHHPHSSLRRGFPQAYKMALAVSRYRTLGEQLEQGIISERKYQKELKKILNYIDIKEDLQTPFVGGDSTYRWGDS